MSIYMVEVNNKFLVKLELDGSALAAEHYFLDGYESCWGANAYDEKAMKTECFRGAILTSELVSLKELDQILKRVDRAKGRVKECEKGLKLIDKELVEYKRQYDECFARKQALLDTLADERKAEDEAILAAGATPRFKA